MKRLFLLVSLLLPLTTIEALTLQPAIGPAVSIDGLVVDGNAYSGHFNWVSIDAMSDQDSFPFIGDQAGALEAVNELAQALDVGGYTAVANNWQNYFWIPFEDPTSLGIVQAYRARYQPSIGWEVTVDSTHGTGFPANSWAQLKSVPIPSAFWLFGSALGFLGWIRCQHAETIAS